MLLAALKCWNGKIQLCAAGLRLTALAAGRHTTCGGSLSRQNGKSLGLVVPRANYGMIMLGEEVLYTSHLQKTSTETFESIATFFDSKPLKKYVKDIKTALGREQVILNNGGRIKFLARTRNGGRGQHGDLLIFDEAFTGQFPSGYFRVAQSASFIRVIATYAKQSWQCIQKHSQ